MESENVSPTLMEEDGADGEIVFLNNGDDHRTFAQEEGGVSTQGGDMVSVPLSVPQFTPSPMVASDFPPFLLKGSGSGLLGLFKMTLSNGNPLKRMRVNTPSSPNFDDIGEDDAS